jgi:hypothetical protein
MDGSSSDSGSSSASDSTSSCTSSHRRSEVVHGSINLAKQLHQQQHQQRRPAPPKILPAARKGAQYSQQQQQQHHSEEDIRRGIEAMREALEMIPAEQKVEYTEAMRRAPRLVEIESDFERCVNM